MQECAVCELHQWCLSAGMYKFLSGIHRCGKCRKLVLITPAGGQALIDDLHCMNAWELSRLCEEEEFHALVSAPGLGDADIKPIVARIKKEMGEDSNARDLMTIARAYGHSTCQRCMEKIFRASMAKVVGMPIEYTEVPDVDVKV